MADLRAVLITAPNRKIAAALAKELIAQNLAACVGVLPGLTSHYRWKGKIHRDSEVLLIAKTRAGLIKKLIAAVAKRHPAEVPEIIALPIREGFKPYLQWLSRL